VGKGIKKEAREMDKPNIAIRNFTPHTINIEGRELPSEGVARLIEEKREVKTYMDRITFKFSSIRYSKVEGLPNNFIEANDLFVVSRPVAQFLHLPCIVSPDSYTRDESGQVTGCSGLAWFPDF